MTKLSWDQVGERRFEAGCDRGVLYLPNADPVVWNGLTAVDEDFSDTTVDAYYLDGVRYLSRRVPGEYAGTLKALTYPDEFIPFDGMAEYDTGVYLSSQPVNQTFGLSYRTMLGNDTEGLDRGYKIHLLYNLTAIPDARTFATITNTITGFEFSWKLSGIPVPVPGFRPSVHIRIDSTKIPDLSVAALENYLYGTDTTTGSLPDPVTLVTTIHDVIFEPISDPI